MARCRCADTACTCSVQGGLGIVVSGNGAPATPYVLSTCVHCEAPGNIGDVLTRQFDGTYAPGPPSQVAPGTIITEDSLSGDGTFAAPLRVNLCTYDDLMAACAP